MGRSLIFSIFPFFLMCFPTQLLALDWAPNERRAYSSREFITLEHLLVARHQIEKAEKVLMQDRDLSGCRALHHGAGGGQAALSCLAFLNREDDLGLTSPSSRVLVSDLNILCKKLAGDPQVLEKLISNGAFGLSQRQYRKWEPCIEETWRQVYLTAYANFDADPVAVLSLFRQAREALPPKKQWIRKINRLMSH